MSYFLAIILALFIGPLLNYSISRLEGKREYKPGLVEILTILTFLFVFTHYSVFEEIVEVVFFLIISSFLIIIFVYDLKHFIIPNKVIYPAMIIAGLYLLLSPLNVAINHLLSASIALLFFISIYYATKEKGMGFGDVRFSFFMGLLLGFPGIIIGLFFSFFLGAIIGTGLMMIGKKGRKSALPFAPFLITGTFIAWFYGESILHFYLTFYV